MNAWGGVIGHPGGVTSIKDLFYVTPGDTVAAFGEAAAAGYAGVEVFDGDLAAHAGDLSRVRAALDEGELTLIGVYSGANFIFAETLAEELWRIRRACELASELGAEHLVLGGGAQRSSGPNGDDYARLATGLDEAARIAEGYGLLPSFHPHMGTIAQSPEQIARVFQSTDIRFCPDTGHQHLGGGDPVHLVREYRDRIAYVHLKDVDDAGRFVPLGQGVLDVAGVVAVLQDTGFAGWITVETDGWTGDPSDGARASFAHLQDLLSRKAS